MFDWLRGRNNPNCKYKSLDDDFFSNINTEFKAYLLGIIASDGSIRENGAITVALKKEDFCLLTKLISGFCPELSLKEKDNLLYFVISSKKCASDIANLLSLNDCGQKAFQVRFPFSIPKELWVHFMRGYFDGDGSVISPGGTKNYPVATISSNSPFMLLDIQEVFGGHVYSGRIEWYNNEALNFLSKIYDGASIYLSRKRDLYLDWSCWVPSLSGRTCLKDIYFKANKSRKDAVFPFKENASDSGYDLTLIDIFKSYGNIILYETGIKVQPAYGWYFDMVPRSSLTKTGYLLANSVGVIDRTYTGTIKVPLVKVNPEAPDLELPIRAVQLIPRPIIHLQLQEVEELDDTERGDGGFGSTGRN